MVSTKVTFTLDAAVDRSREAAARLALPKSEVVREAILDYYERIGRLGEREKLQLLRTFDEGVPRIPGRKLREVERELQALRQSRRAGGRKA